ncbi:MAG: WD40 repeat domain-containing protein, partial [Aggregatilineales bacterium]
MIDQLWHTTWLPVSDQVAVSDWNDIYIYTIDFEQIDEIRIVENCVEEDIFDCLRILQMRWSPDERYFAVVLTNRSNSYLQIWDFDSRQMLHEFSTASMKTGAIFWSSDSSFVAFSTTHEDNTAQIQLLNALDGSIYHSFDYIHDDYYPLEVVWHPDSTEIVIISSPIEVWNIAQQSPVQIPISSLSADSVLWQKVVYNYDGSQMASIIQDEYQNIFQIDVWDRTTREILFSYENDTLPVERIWWHRDWIITIAGSDNEEHERNFFWRIWDSKTGELITEYLFPRGVNAQINETHGRLQALYIDTRVNEPVIHNAYTGEITSFLSRETQPCEEQYVQPCE